MIAARQKEPLERVAVDVLDAARRLSRQYPHDERRAYVHQYIKVC